MKPMLMMRALLGAMMIVSVAAAQDQGWKPAPVPLMTQWGAKVTPDNVWPEYPRPQMVRKNWTNLNGLWQYGVTAKDADKPQWQGRILVPFCIESSLSGVGRRVSENEALWYRRTFTTPQVPKDGRLLLHFGAVDYQTKVFVNGKEVGRHQGGNTPFTFDITEALKSGSNAEQELMVWVWDPTDTGSQPRGKQVRDPHGIWYTPVTGIWQTVWLEAVPRSHISWLKITPDVDHSSVQVTVLTDGTADNHRVEVTVTDPTVASEHHPVARQRGEAGKELTLKIAKPKLWSPDAPTLYDLKIRLLDGDRVLDEVTTYTAMRKIELGKDDKGLVRMMLNGKPLFQYGTLDQGWWPDGLLTPPSDEAMAFDLKYLKAAGFNMLRKHIKVEPARLYYHCDRLGLLVWQDMPSGFKTGAGQNLKPNAPEDAVFAEADKQQFRYELKQMMDWLHNFPSIVVWVPFNEGWGQHDTNQILKWTMAHDPSRLVGGPSGWEDRGFGHLKDMHSYPGPNMFPVIDGRASVLGEFGGLGLPVEGHTWQESKNWGYRTYKTVDELKQNYERLMINLHPLIDQGLAAAIYTQTTDVEIEVNGLLTYDRKVDKMGADWLKKLHEPLIREPAPRQSMVVPSAEKAAQTWRFTLQEPAKGWTAAGFDDSNWKEGKSGFGTKGTPNSIIGTTWNGSDIYLRREFDLKDVGDADYALRIHHDDDTEVYINGVPAARFTNHVTQYMLVPISDEAEAALKEGRNVIAIHTKQTGGGQYIDAGIVKLEPRN